jgi:hypothetical protein
VSESAKALEEMKETHYEWLGIDFLFRASTLENKKENIIAKQQRRWREEEGERSRKAMWQNGQKSIESSQHTTGKEKRKKFVKELKQTR